MRPYPHGSVGPAKKNPSRVARRERARLLSCVPLALAGLTVSSVALADEPTAKPAEATLPQAKAADAEAPKKEALAELTTLRILREKGVINDAELESATKEVGDSTGAHAPDANTLVIGKWATTLYGFAEADYIYDSTQGLNESPGNSQIAKPGTFQGDHDRSQMSIRNSRFGFRSKAPEYHGIRASAQLEWDFLGTQLPIAPLGTASAAYNGSEQSFFTAPTFRARHANLKVETPYIDVLFGQYWSLYGWNAAYAPNTVEIQGVPGEIYNRNVQLRLSKTVKTDAITFEAAIAAMRPPQRDSGVPEGQAGLRFAYNHWKGVQTVGPTNTQIAPVSIAVTGDMKQVRLPELSAAPKEVKQRVSSALAVDGFLPIIPGEKGKMGNSLSFTGELSYGYGTADLYSGVGGAGTSYPALPNPTNASPAPVYAPNIDSGIVQYDASGALHYIQWTSWLIGVQYYFPGLDGHVWASANYSRMTSANIQEFGAAGKPRSDLDWWDANLFADLTPAVRLGAEYAETRDAYAGGVHATNQRFQFSMFYVF